MAEDSEIEWVLPVQSELSSEQIILKDFICNLKALPELWDSSAKAYSDKIKRATALQKLLNVFKKASKIAKQAFFWFSRDIDKRPAQHKNYINTDAINIEHVAYARDPSIY